MMEGYHDNLVVASFVYRLRVCDVVARPELELRLRSNV